MKGIIIFSGAIRTRLPSQKGHIVRPGHRREKTGLELALGSLSMIMRLRIDPGNEAVMIQAQIVSPLIKDIGSKKWRLGITRIIEEHPLALIMKDNIGPFVLNRPFSIPQGWRIWFAMEIGMSHRVIQSIIALEAMNLKDFWKQATEQISRPIVHGEATIVGLDLIMPTKIF